MEPILIVLVVLVALVLAFLIKAIHVIPQAGAAVVERYGRYTRTLTAGMNLVVPFMDSIRARVDLREQVVTFPPQPVLTRDNLVVSTETVVYFQVSDVRAAVYEVANYIQAIDQLLITTLRNLIGGMELERALIARGEIGDALRGVLGEAADKWGIRVNRVELKAIDPPAAIRDAREKQRSADHEKRAAILQAEGERQAARLRAEAEREAVTVAPGGEAEDAVRVAPLSFPKAYRPADHPPGHRPMRESDPRRIGRYQLTARLGQGGMGTVYLGRSPGERMVAVKVINAELAADPTFRQRFSREIEAARRVGGFHTAPVVAADAQGDPPWLVTEYIPGPSLNDVIGQHGALPVRTLHTLAAGVAEALEGIHACGIVHRDLKPSNIIFSEAGPRVIDFGIARALDSTAITRTDHVIGTQGFLAPEQFTGEPVTFAADVYAFGMVLCHAAGAVPSAGESFASALGLLPSHLGELVTRCVDRDPARRPTPTEALEHLAPSRSSTGEWLPPPVRTMVDLHNASTAPMD